MIFCLKKKTIDTVLLIFLTLKAIPNNTEENTKKKHKNYFSIPLHTHVMKTKKGVEISQEVSFIAL